MYIISLVVEPGREAHIARHGVRLAEVDEVVFGSPFPTRTREGRRRLIGQTQGGRYLTVIVVSLGYGVYALIAARDADDAERRRHLAWRRR